VTSADSRVIVRRDEAEYADWIRTEHGFLEAFGRVDADPLRLEPFQRAFLSFRHPDTGRRPQFRWVTKARQIGMSFVIAAEALARCHLRDRHTAVFISYNLEDAKEKIAVARAMYEELPLSFQKRLVMDAKTELQFESKTRRRGGISRIVSHPSRAPRGRHGDVYLDELAHYIFDSEVYRGATAVILRSRGQLTGCSTPLGKRGIFWDIAAQSSRSYPHHKRFEIPWWLCSFFCSDVRQALVEAPSMPTEERVEVFGAGGIVAQFESLPLDDFQQEFECAFVDESFSYFPYELILPCTSDELGVGRDPSDVKKPKGRLVAGVDIGRVKDRTELEVFEEVSGVQVERLHIGMKGVTFQEQEEQIRRVLVMLPIAEMRIDQTGLGMHLAENLGRDFPQVIPVTFTNSTKERWATDLKIQLQQRKILVERDRGLIGQFHSIRRSVTGAGRVRFDSERSPGGGHADRFWAIALACQFEREEETDTEFSVRVI